MSPEQIMSEAEALVRRIKESDDHFARVAAFHALRAAYDRWRCFHCDKSFTSYDEAQKHFGYKVSLYPTCVVQS